jgi:hypothetical protein
MNVSSNSTASKTPISPGYRAWVRLRSRRFARRSQSGGCRCAIDTTTRDERDHPALRRCSRIQSPRKHRLVRAVLRATARLRVGDPVVWTIDEHTTLSSSSQTRVRNPARTRLSRATHLWSLQTNGRAFPPVGATEKRCRWALISNPARAPLAPSTCASPVPAPPPGSSA